MDRKLPVESKIQEWEKKNRKKTNRRPRIPENGERGGVDPAGEAGGVPLTGDGHPAGLLIIILLVTRGASSCMSSLNVLEIPPLTISSAASQNRNMSTKTNLFNGNLKLRRRKARWGLVSACLFRDSAGGRRMRAFASARGLSPAEVRRVCHPRVCREVPWRPT